MCIFHKNVESTASYAHAHFLLVTTPMGGGGGVVDDICPLDCEIAVSGVVDSPYDVSWRRYRPSRRIVFLCS